MKLEIKIAKDVPEDKVIIEAKEQTAEVKKVIDFVGNLQQGAERLTAKKDEEVYLLDWPAIDRLVIEDKVVHAKTASATYTTSYRLYQLKELVPSYFLQISQSEIINLNQLDHLQITPNGLVKLIFKNQDVTYSSRRYLKAIKEALNL
ncbi:LytTR family DNA-binding domain-containing protein [Streptococcus cameli]